MWASVAGNNAEWVAKALATTSPTSLSIPTHLTQANRSQGRDRVRRRQARDRTPSVSLPLACRSCRAVVSADRVYCDKCAREALRERTEKMVTAAHAKLARLRAEGRDPGHTSETHRKMGAKNAIRRREESAWDAVHEQPDLSIFGREILPAIQTVPLRRLAAATGLSVTYCGQVRRGDLVPHPRHWDAFREAGVIGR